MSDAELGLSRSNGNWFALHLNVFMYDSLSEFDSTIHDTPVDK